MYYIAQICDSDHPEENQILVYDSDADPIEMETYFNKKHRWGSVLYGSETLTFYTQQSPIVLLKEQITAWVEKYDDFQAMAKLIEQENAPLRNRKTELFSRLPKPIILNFREFSDEEKIRKIEELKEKGYFEKGEHPFLKKFYPVTWDAIRAEIEPELQEINKKIKSMPEEYYDFMNSPNG